MAIDLDNDNDLDVIGTSQGNNEVSWWRNEGGNPVTWTKYVIDGNFSRVWPLYAGDLDGDSDIDVVAASGYAGNNEVKWYRNELITEVEETQSQGTLLQNKLFDNYPNPFNPTTTISFYLPVQNFVSLKVYDFLGDEIITLVNEEKYAGSYEITWNAEGLSSGVYFYQLEAGEVTSTRKMLLLR